MTIKEIVIILLAIIIIGFTIAIFVFVTCMTIFYCLDYIKKIIIKQWKPRIK